MSEEGDSMVASEQDSGSVVSNDDKGWRRKAKKLRKRARNGEILTLEQTLECAKYGVTVKAEVEWSTSLLEGKRSQLHVSEVRDAVLHILKGPTHQHKHAWLTITNAGLVSKVMVVGLSGVESSYLLDNLPQLPFLQSCGRPMPITFYKGKGVRRAIYPLLFFKNEQEARGEVAEEAEESEDEEEEEASDQEAHSETEKKKAGNGGECGAANGASEGGEEEEEKDVSEAGSDVTVSVDPVERYVMSPVQQEQEVQILLAAAAEAERGEGGEEDEDLGEPVDQQPPQPGTPPSTQAPPEAAAWLTCDDKGVWGETGTLLPDLEQARTLLGRLQGLKVTPTAPFFFYETLGGRDPRKYHHMVALDCEMCQTAEGSEVTRLTLVDERRGVLLDSFVKPYNLIVDYHTKYSGITPEIMARCDTRLEQVQVALLRLLRADTILVGHSLEQDLMVVRLMHLRCIDTAILYPHPRGGTCRYALRVLSRKYLQRVIQNSKLGHCSEEDAVAALDLVHLKVARGPEFGVEGLGAAEDTRGRLSVLDLLHEAGKRSVLVDQSETLSKCVRGQTAAIVARSNDEVISKAKSQASQSAAPHFMWAGLSGGRPPSLDTIAIKKQRAEELQNQSSKRIKLEKTESINNGAVQMNRHIKFTYEEAIMEMVDRELLRADQALAEIFEALAPSTLLIVLTQPDVSLPSQLLMQRQTSFDVRATLPWSEENEQVLNELTKQAQEGLIMMRVR